jgi:hypothetical protein
MVFFYLFQRELIKLFIPAPQMLKWAYDGHRGSRKKRGYPVILWRLKETTSNDNV